MKGLPPSAFHSRPLPGCRYVSRALALCLHQSTDCARSSACDEQRVTILLALAFPGQVQLPGLQKQCLAGPKRGSDRKRTASASAVRLSEVEAAVSFIRDQATRENSLSCLCSIVKVMLLPEIIYRSRAKNTVLSYCCAKCTGGWRCVDQQAFEALMALFCSGSTLVLPSQEHIGTLSCITNLELACGGSATRSYIEVMLFPDDPSDVRYQETQTNV